MAFQPVDPAISIADTLADILAPGLDVVFVGINPSIYSARRGHYFARPSNRFWATLYQSNLVAERLRPEDDVRLPDFGIGLTDIVKRPTHSSAELSMAEFRFGQAVLREKLLRYAPRAVCFVGKLAYVHYSGQRLITYGRQPVCIGAATVFVMPSTSGRANGLHRERVRGLEELRTFLGR